MRVVSVSEVLFGVILPVAVLGVAGYLAVRSDRPWTGFVVVCLFLGGWTWLILFLASHS